MLLLGVKDQDTSVYRCPCHALNFYYCCSKFLNRQTNIVLQYIKLQCENIFAAVYCCSTLAVTKCLIGKGIGGCLRSIFGWVGLTVSLSLLSHLMIGGISTQLCLQTSCVIWVLHHWYCLLQSSTLSLTYKAIIWMDVPSLTSSLAPI